MRIASQGLLFVIDLLLGYAGADTDALPAGGVLHVTAASQQSKADWNSAEIENPQKALLADRVLAWRVIALIADNVLQQMLQARPIRIHCLQIHSFLIAFRRGGPLRSYLTSPL